jgi:predicted RNA-binding protein with RPS1 domain
VQGKPRVNRPATGHIKKVEDAVKVGDEIMVKFAEMDSKAA